MRLTNLPFFDFFKDENPGRIMLISSLAILSIGLPLSPFLVGSSQFLLLLSWFIEGDFAYKFKQLKQNRALHIFLILPLLHIIWLLNTQNYGYALHDIKIKLPLVAFPILLGTTRPIKKKESDFIFALFILAVFSGTMVTMAILTGLYPYPHQDIRDASIFISHIRFGLMIIFAIVLLGKYIMDALKANKNNLALGLSLLVLWMLFFLIILQSLTSWIIFFILAFFIFFFYYKEIENRILKTTAWFVLSIMLMSVIGGTGLLIHNFYFKKTLSFSELPAKTPRGNNYLNDTLSTTKENGHYVRILISYKELSQTWPKVSQVPFDGKDANGYPIWATLIRYLASKGLPKDQDGVLALDTEDVKMIEQGYASCVYKLEFIPYIRSYGLLWELDRYFKSGDANNKSVAQRLEYLRAARYIISQNFWFGVGTGDLQNAYDQAFIDINSKLREKNRFRAHNQYVTFFVTFGVFGFILAFFSIIRPALKFGQRHNFVLTAFIFIILMSMINEDTLETQAGVTFYIFFYTLILFSSKKQL
jgi:O-antigen ligase